MNVIKIFILLLFPISLVAQETPFFKKDQLMLSGMVNAGADKQSKGRSLRVDGQRMLKMKGLGLGASLNYVGSEAIGNAKYTFLSVGPMLGYHLDISKRIYPFVQTAYQFAFDTAEYEDEVYEDIRTSSSFYRVDIGALIRLSKRTGVRLEVSAEEFKNVQFRVGFTGVIL